ncbi:MAG: hypothetical protein M1298_03670, partial [Chloroflexi bacterium]|nr:hypothetical protein [Chloroflexota bacterium]
MNIRRWLAMIALIATVSLIFGISFIGKRPPRAVTSQRATPTAQQTSATAKIVTSSRTSSSARAPITLPVSNLPQVQILSVIPQESGVVINYRPVSGAKDYRVFEVSHPGVVKYAGIVHYNVNCTGTPERPHCSGKNHFVMQADGKVPVFPYQVSTQGAGPQQITVPNDQIQWNYAKKEESHILIVQAVNELGPVPAGNLYNDQNQPLHRVHKEMLGGNAGLTLDGKYSTNGQGPATAP